MLNRRQSLAQAMARQHPGLTDVTAGAGALDFPTNQAAQAAGQADGTKALQAIEDRGHDDFILAELKKYADDPAYMAAFFTALGPQGLTALGLQVTGYQQAGDKGQYQDWAAAVGEAFATASYQMPYREGWLGQLQLPNAPMGDPGLPQLSLIQPFLEHGVYSPAWLDPLGKYAIQQAYLQQQPGMAGIPVPLDGIWTALAHNPAFDAQFYRQNFSNDNNPADSISGIMSSMYTISVADSAFAGMVRSALIPPQGSDGAPFAANAQLTVRYFGGNADARTSGDVRQVLGQVAMFYFDDMYSTVGAAVPGIGEPIDPKKPEDIPDIPGLQVTASSTYWGNFLDEVMRDKTASAQFLTFYSAWRNQFSDNQSPWANEQFKLMDDFVVHQYQATGEQAGTDPGGISDIVAAAGSAFLTSLVFGPEAGVADALLGGAKDGFKTGVENTISGAFGGDGETLTNPVPPEAIRQITQADSNWERIVRKWYGDGGQPVPGAVYGGQPAIGDPQYYIRQFGPDASFLGADNKLLPLSEIQSHPAKLAAYNAWLESGAIADAWVPGVSPRQRLITVFHDQASDSGY
jgi:hypothetical protein